MLWASSRSITNCAAHSRQASIQSSRASARMGHTRIHTFSDHGTGTGTRISRHTNKLKSSRKVCMTCLGDVTIKHLILIAGRLRLNLVSWCLFRALVMLEDFSRVNLVKSCILALEIICKRHSRRWFSKDFTRLLLVASPRLRLHFLEPLFSVFSNSLDKISNI